MNTSPLATGSRDLLNLMRRVDAGRLSPWLIDSLGGDPGRQVQFYLGAHRPHWLTVSPVPLFISANTLMKYRSSGDDWPTRRAGTFGCGIWACDSGGFTELRDYGHWRQHPDEYGGMITRLIEEVGAPPVFVSPQDWMCEPWVIAGGTHQGQRFAGTGLDVRTHLELTVENLLYLREQFPHVPWAPVLQGWRLEDYQLCHQMYADAGVDLAAEPLVGLGSVCRRQSTAEIGLIVETFWRAGLSLHGFGVKRDGVIKYGSALASFDSMAWSFGARADRVRLPGCRHAGPCNNCLRYALVWREKIMHALQQPQQLTFDLFGAPPPQRGRGAVDAFPRPFASDCGLPGNPARAEFGPPLTSPSARAPGR
ncbi:hypothetical protein AB0B10_25725 [Micromonospora arborensis]|uniref:deazapurine DNA modification protein DpdA family protein n=1 Tax=Micromonospora arborensis TaxID=2116518 RepID=UPI0033E45F56